MLIDVNFPLLSVGMNSPGNFGPPHDLSNMLVKSTFLTINEISFHEVWCALSTLHSCLLLYSFMDRNGGSFAKFRGEELF